MMKKAIFLKTFFYFTGRSEKPHIILPGFQTLARFSHNLFVCMALAVGAAHAQSPTPTGAIKGVVIDKDTRAPLIGANVMLVGTQKGAATDANGSFLLQNIPAGNYTLRFSYIGYAMLAKTDIIVRSQRTTFVEAMLKMASVEMDQVVVSAGYFSEIEEQPVSAINFSAEEIRRAPGSAGDISRIIMGLPSVAKVNDQSNSLIVRGGSPLENAFFVDNIEIPNINHFPTQATSGGPIGMLNVDFIRDVSFYAGGFSPMYGDRLSSVMDIAFREGNRDAFDGQLDLNFTGFGGVVEGPVVKNRGSWLLSVRRSYLDLLIDAIDVGTSVAPVYGDIQGKLVYDLDSQHRLTALLVWGDDHNSPDQQTARENDMIFYGNQDIVENTTGINWRALWGGHGYSNTSLSSTSTKFKEDFFETGSGNLLVKNRSVEKVFKLRNTNHFRLSTKNFLEFGLEAKYLVSDYENFYPAYSDAFGDAVSALGIDKTIAATRIGAYINFIIQPLHRLTTTLGIRTDYFSYNENISISPRFSFAYKFSNRTSLHGAAGLYYQNLPLLLLSQNTANQDLKDPAATHYILGLSHLFTENTRLSLEVYQKNYRHFPVDPSQPALFMLDELFYRYGFFFNHNRLVDDGKALSRGVELMVQKKLAKNFYGLASAAYFRSKYTGTDGILRNRVFDNRLIFSLEGGYKPNNQWEFSLRWLYAGGPPFTPFDLDASRALNRAVLDEDKINEARYPAYHSLNIRFDRRFHFNGSNLVFYFSVWNTYNRKNVATYFWNQVENKQDAIRQWGMLPIFGLEFEW